MRTTLLVVLALVTLAAAPGAAAGDPTGWGAPGADGSTGSIATAGVQAHDTDAARSSASTTTASSDEHDACAAVAGGPQRENPETDTLGWENGCWYDDSLAVTMGGGLNDTELAAVSARTMARVEHIRELEFARTVPVEVISRAEYRERNAEQFANVTDAQRLHQNVKHEALFFVGEGDDAIAQMQTNRAGSVLGYYSPSRDRIVVVSDDPDSLELGELTLAHELVHAAQDQHFNLSQYNRSTTEEDKSILGLIEGDARYTEHLYEDRCGADWECPSIESSQPSIPDGFHWGQYFMNFQPYSDGPRFVATVRDAGGWAAVDDLYGNPPASSEQVIAPEKYPDERPVEVTVEDRSNDRWRVLELEQGINYAELGQVGISTMFIYPTYEGTPRFVSNQEFQNTGPESDLDPLDYANEYSDGWAGDRLVPYVTDASARTNETGYVWKTVWDSPGDAADFAEAYVELLALHGGDPVDGRVDTYRIPGSSPYSDAFYVNRTGTSVVIVNAPTVDDLDGIRANAARETSPTPTLASPTDDESPGGGSQTESSDGRPPPTATTAPGSGVVVALVAALLVAFAIRRA